MAYPFEIPGYVQGFRFSDDPLFYTSGSKTFLDLSEYGAAHPANNLTITTGTPAFVTDTSGERGLTLDNTVQGDFLPAIPWEGSAVIVARAHIVGTGTQNLNILVFGSSPTVSSNGRLNAAFGSSNINWDWVTTGGAARGRVGDPDETALKVLGYATDQATRKAYATEDGITISESAAVAASNNGNGVAMGFHVSTVPNAQRVRFGNLSGTIGDSVATASSLTIFEAHFYVGNIWTDHASQAQAFMAALRAKYGLA